MEFRILGPLEVVSDGRIVELPSAKERALLLDLLLHAGSVVSVGRLIDDLWDPAPRSANVSLRVLVSRLRKALASRPAADRLATRSPGYLLTLDPGDVVDLPRFDALVARGCLELEEGKPKTAADTLAEAVALWRGPAFGELADLPFARAEAARLEQARLAAIGARIDADLLCGRHTRLVGELEALTAEHPLWERVWAQRMLALYRCGRQADALAAYRDLQQHFRDELGLDPGRELQELERAILKQAPGLDLPVASPSPRVSAGAELPSGVLTFLLTDIEGSTAMWDSCPSVMGDVLGRHDATIDEIVASHGGILLRSKGEGDSTLSVFRRASDAGFAALAVQQTLAATGWPEGIDLRVRIALHTGEMQERDGDYHGPALNRAARLRTLAAGGQIFVSEVTTSLLRDHLPQEVALVDRGRHALRGLARDEQVFELIAAPAEGVAETEANALRPELPAPLTVWRLRSFAGRERELARLHRLWEQTQSGEVRAALIAGEPGIGKTRLASELAVAAHEAGATVLYGRCDEGLGSPYQPFVEALRPYIASEPSRRLRADVGTGLAEMTLLLPELAERIPGLGVTTAGDPDADRLRLFDAVLSLLAAGSARAPMVVVLDDLHWASKPTLILLRHLLRAPRGISLLVVGTYRDTELDRSHPLADMLADFRSGAGVERISLLGVDAGAVATMLEAVLGTGLDANARALVEAVHRETQGNPFFVGEVLRHLVDTGAIAGGTVVHADARARLPESVREAVVRRLSRLSDAANQALRVAALVGPRFSLQLLERVVEDADTPSRLLDAIEEAARARLVIETGAETYAFAHELIRQTLNGELTTTRRLRLHRTIAHALEELHVGDREDHLEELAYHYCEAAATGEAEKAIEYATAAAERAMRQIGWDQAAQFYAAALEINEDCAADEYGRAELLLGLGGAQWRGGDIARARETYGRAAQLADKLDDAEMFGRAVLGFAGADVAQLLPDFFNVNDELIRLLEQAHGRLGREVSQVHATILAQLAMALAWVPGSDARRDALSAEAVDMADRLGAPRTLATILAWRCWAIVGPDTIDERERTASRVRALAEETGDPMALNLSSVHIALAAWERGDVERFEREIELGRQIAEKARIPSYRMNSQVTDAAFALFRGDFSAAEARMNEAFQLGQEFQDPMGLVGAGAGAFAHARDLGFLDEYALDELLRALDDVAAASSLGPSHQIVLTAGIALGLAEKGLLAAAGDAFERVAAKDFADIPRDFGWLVTLAMLAQVCARIGDRKRGALLYDLLLPYQDRHAEAMVSLGPIAGALGSLAVLLSRWDDAERHFDSALAWASRSGARPAVARTQTAYAAMLLARGNPADATRAAAMLHDAKHLADELGMRVVAQEALQLMAPSQGRRSPAAAPDRRARGDRARDRLVAFGRARAARLTAGMSDEDLVRRFGSPLALRAIFAALPRTLDLTRTAGSASVTTLELRRPESGGTDTWTVEVDGTRARAWPGRPAKPDATVHMALADFMRMLSGEFSLYTALDGQRVRVEGDLFALLRLRFKRSVMRAVAGGLLRGAPNPEAQPDASAAR